MYTGRGQEHLKDKYRKLVHLDIISSREQVFVFYFNTPTGDRNMHFLISVKLHYIFGTKSPAAKYKAIILHLYVICRV